MGYVLARYGADGYAETVPFGENLRKQREARGLNQSQLARKLGVPPARVWDWETQRYKAIELKNLGVQADAGEPATRRRDRRDDCRRPE